MKLKNKRTGEIATLTLSSNGEDLLLMKNNEMVIRNVKLSDLEEWEDYEEEEKEYYTVNSSGQIWTTECFNVDSIKDMKSIGNYFETREETEKAVEKLNALKRLKDKGFRFEGWTIDDGLRISICTNIDSDGIYDEYRKEVKNDLDVCFGGEE